MKVDTMRAIDRLAGVPLCFVLSSLHQVFGRRRRRRLPKRILFIELSEMGSTILADPAMRKARDRLGAELFFVIFKRNVESLDFLRTIPPSNIFTIREDSLTNLLWDTGRFLMWTRRHSIDTVVDLELFSRFTSVLTALSGATNRAGFYRFHEEGLYRGEVLTHRVAYNPHIHIAKNFIALVNALGSPVDEVPYSKTIIDDSEIRLTKAAVSEQLRREIGRRIASAAPDFDPAANRLVLINPNASELLPQRRWPRSHFADLARMVHDRWPDVFVFITGAPAEREEAEMLRAEVSRPRIVNFAGALKLAELPALYSLAGLMVTNDSGPGHFSAITDLATIVLFGPETPVLYGSLGNSQAITAGLACSPCVSAHNHRKTACRDPVCMRAITPVRVLGAVAKVLDRGKPARVAGTAVRHLKGLRAQNNA